MSYTIPKEDIAKTLYNMNRTYDGQQTWKNAFYGLNAAEQVQEADLAYDYGSAVSQAYAANIANRDAISSSSLGQGYKNTHLAANQSNLEAAFDEYRNNYLKNRQTIAQNFGNARNTISQSLYQQAENMERYNKATYAYLQALAQKYPELYSNDEFKRYFKENSQSDTGYSLLSNDELFAGFRTDDGYLNEAGKNFYKHMYGISPTETGGIDYTFQNFLEESKEYGDLTDWALSNSYDAGYTNQQVFQRDVLGLDIDDMTYLNDLNLYKRQLDAGEISDVQYEQKVNDYYVNEKKTANDATWSIHGLGSGSAYDDLDVAINGQHFNIRTDEKPIADDELIKNLNKLSTGSENKTPSADKEAFMFGDVEQTNESKAGKLVVYEGNMYLYTITGWRKLIDHRDSVQDAINTYLSTGNYKNK